MVDQVRRLKRAKKTRCKLKELKVVRLSVHRTPRHIYAQLIDPQGLVLATASTIEKTIKGVKYTGNVDAAKKVGELIAKRGIEKGVTVVGFDRSGFRYHGRVKALADAAREGGIQF